MAPCEIKQQIEVQAGVNGPIRTTAVINGDVDREGPHAHLLPPGVREISSNDHATGVYFDKESVVISVLNGEGRRINTHQCTNRRETIFPGGSIQWCSGESREDNKKPKEPLEVVITHLKDEEAIVK